MEHVLGPDVHELHVGAQEGKDRVQVRQLLDAHRARLQPRHLFPAQHLQQQRPQQLSWLQLLKHY